MKYIMIFVGLFVSFGNLFDCIVQNSPLIDYALYFGVIFIGTMFLILFNSNIYMCSLLALWGLITIGQAPPLYLSGGILFLIFSKRIANNLTFSVLMYFVTAVVLIAKSAFDDISPTETINLILVYLAFYLIDYLIYNIDRK